MAKKKSKKTDEKKPKKPKKAKTAAKKAAPKKPAKKAAKKAKKGKGVKAAPKASKPAAKKPAAAKKAAAPKTPAAKKADAKAKWVNVQTILDSSKAADKAIRTKLNDKIKAWHAKNPNGIPADKVLRTTRKSLTLKLMDKKAAPGGKKAAASAAPAAAKKLTTKLGKAPANPARIEYRSKLSAARKALREEYQGLGSGAGRDAKPLSASEALFGA